MWKPAAFIARKEIAYALRERQTLLWLFVMPIVFFYFIGTITGGFATDLGPVAPRLTLVEPGPTGFLHDELVRRLEDNGYSVRRVGPTEELGEARRVLRVPEEFEARLLAGETTRLTLERRGEGLSADYDRVRVNRAAYTVLADLVVTVALDRPLAAEGLEALAATPRTVTLDVRPAGKRLEIPSGFEQAVPGILVMFTLTVLLTSGAVSLVIERNQGLLRRLASTPMPRGGIVLGKWAGRWLLALVQVVFAMIAGTVLFDIDWGPDLPMVLLVLAAWAALCASLGLLLGCEARTEGQATGIGVLASNVLAALGGCWWPIEITPDWMQSLARLLPTGWTMNALHQLVAFRSGAQSAVTETATLAFAAVIVGWAAARRFRFD